MDRYKLHLTSEDIVVLQKILDNCDWFCDCSGFPNCDDFKRFQKLKTRLATLQDRSIKSAGIGRLNHRRLKQKYLEQGVNIGMGKDD